MRYAIMSWWRAAKPEPVEDTRERYDKKGDEILKRLAGKLNPPTRKRRIV
jgi:hypothetical protein